MRSIQVLVGTNSRLYLVDETGVIRASPEVREVSETTESTAHMQNHMMLIKCMITCRLMMNHVIDILLVKYRSLEA